jgi:GAF domain-containing protein
MSSPSSGAHGSALLRRFSAFYLAFAVIPFVLLFYMYCLYDEDANTISLPRWQMSLLVLCVGVSALLGFLGARAMLVKFVRLADNMRRTALGRMDKSVIVELAREKGEVADLARSFGDVFSRLEANIRELEETKRTLHDVASKVSRALSSQENFGLLMQLVLETAVDSLGARSGVVFALEGKDGYVLKAGVGLGPLSPRDALTAARSSLDWVSREQRMFVLPLMGGEQGHTLLAAPLVVAPLFCRGTFWGALCLSGNRFGRNFSEDELKIVSNVSSQVAISFENAQLNRDMERTYLETMAALALAVEARDPYSRGHSEQVSVYATRIGEKMGLAPHDLQTLRDAARLHDIGKIGVDDSILRKPGALSSDEWTVMRRHPTIGENIVMPLRNFSHLLDPIRHHHERLDGSGYPDGLGGASIPLVTRIMMVADVFDALTTDRPYRRALSVEVTRTELDSLVAGKKVDGEVVKSLYALVDEGGIAPAKAAS